MKNKHLGTNFDDFLKDEGNLAETEAAAVKRVVVRRRRRMNIRVFLVATVLMTLALFALSGLRGGLDEIYHTSAFLRTIDAICGWALMIFGFALSLTVILAGESSSRCGFLILALTLVASGIIWGLIVERAMYLMHLMKGRTSSKATEL